MAEDLSQWQLENAHALTGKFTRYAKKHAAEYDALFANLDKIMVLLRGGKKVGGFHVNFFRSEGEGVYRIGQTGVRAAQESRLYVYPDNDKKLMYLLIIGDKRTQSDDVNEAKQITRVIRPISTETRQPNQG